MGKIVLASNIGGSLDNTVDGVSGKLFESNNAQSLADAIDWALKLPAKEKEKISKAAIKNVKDNFTKQIMCVHLRLILILMEILFQILVLKADVTEI